MQTEAQKRAKKKYDEKTAVHVGLKFNKKSDADIIKKLESVGSKQTYIKELIRKDL